MASRNSLVTLQAIVHAQKKNTLGALRRSVSRSRQALLNNPGPSRRSHSGFPAAESPCNASAKSAKRSRRATGNALQKSPGLQLQGARAECQGPWEEQEGGQPSHGPAWGYRSDPRSRSPSRCSLGRSEASGGLLEAAPRSARGIRT